MNRTKIQHEGERKMKVKINKQELSEGLDIVSRGVAGTTTLPILRHVMLEAMDGKLRLTTNNLEIAIVTNVGAEVEEAGGVTVPFRLFDDYVGALGEGQIALSVAKKTWTLSVESENDEGTIKGMPVDEFPRPPVIEGDTIGFTPADLLDTIDMVAFAASTNESRPVLTGVFVNLVEQKLKMTAADGFRLSEYKRTIAGGNGEHQLLIPAKALGELVRISKKFPEDAIEMTAGEDRLIFSVGATMLTCSLLGGTFPEAGKIIPDVANTTTTMTVDRAAFLNAVKTTRVFAKHSAGITVLEIGQGKVSVCGSAVEYGDNVGECDAEVEGDDLKIAFGAEYLIDALSALKDEKAVFHFTTPSAPLLIRREGFSHVIMPMHVSG